MPDISVLLTTYNRRLETIKCLDKLLKQKTDKVEIILLNDYHLTDDVLETYCYEKDINYIHTGSQKGGKVHWRVPGFAYNIGAKVARGHYLVIGGAEMYHLNDNCLNLMYESPGAAYPRVWDEPYSAHGDYKKYKRLNAKYPFCFGVSKEIYTFIGGYDEDFTGYCFDDADFSERVEIIVKLNEINADVIHLWNPRGAENRGDKRINTEAWNYNKALYEKRKSSIIRNINKEWGTYEQNI